MNPAIQEVVNQIYLLKQMIQTPQVHDTLVRLTDALAWLIAHPKG